MSDGRWEIYQAQQEHRDPVDELPIGSHIVIDTGRPLQEQLADVAGHIEQARPALT